MNRLWKGAAAPLWVASILAASAPPARAFTQCGGLGCAAFPIGHEALVALSGRLALSALGDDYPRSPTWTRGLETWLDQSNERWKIALPNLDLLVGRKAFHLRNFGAQYDHIWAAVMGQRWVDTAGFPIVGQKTCWDAVTQLQEGVQRDHFLRTSAQAGPQGAAEAIRDARARFVEGFVEAALAPDETIEFRDGGAWHDTKKADYAFFLLGRPLHLLQDSYSPEHALRDLPENPQHLLDVHTYLCTAGSWQHAHTLPLANNPAAHGDVIWKVWNRFTKNRLVYLEESLAQLTDSALQATLASAKVWTAFFLVHGLQQPTERVAREVGEELAQEFFVDDTENPEKGASRLKTATRVSRRSGGGPVTEECAHEIDLSEIARRAQLCREGIKAAPNSRVDRYLQLPFSYDTVSPSLRPPEVGCESSPLGQDSETEVLRTAVLPIEDK